jgi:pimeloyl-ACP methyl ester carboxylesterase
VSKAQELLIVAGLSVFTLSHIAVAADEPPTADPFPDSAENRALFEESRRAYEDLDRTHGRFVDVNGIRMHYLEWGKPGGVPLVWSHGSTSTGFELLQVGQGLADMGYHVFAITYRGHGQTRVSSYDFSLAHIADDVAAFLDQQQLGCAVIGGLSLGGGVTTTFYELYPARTLGLVLEDGGAFNPQWLAETHYEALKALYAAQPVPTASAPSADPFFAFRDAAMPYLPLIRLHPEVATIVQSFIRQDEQGLWQFHADTDRMLGSDAASWDPARNHELSLLAQSWRRVNPIIAYRNLDVPMLIIDPTGDDAGPLGSLTPEYKQLESLHPSLVHYVAYPETLHAAHPQQPEWFLRDMRDLLGRVRAAGTDRCLKRPR